MIDDYPGFMFLFPYAEMDSGWLHTVSSSRLGDRVDSRLPYPTLYNHFVLFPPSSGGASRSFPSGDLDVTASVDPAVAPFHVTIPT